MEEALDLSFDRLLMMMMTESSVIFVIGTDSVINKLNFNTRISADLNNELNYTLLLVHINFQRSLILLLELKFAMPFVKIM